MFCSWRLARHCIIPAESFFEPDWRKPDGEILRSYTMLTINANDHPLMSLYHKPEDEKRMVVVLTMTHGFRRRCPIVWRSFSSTPRSC